MQLAGKFKRRLVDEINITPLTDVFLVLLIIMMVVAPMMKATRMDIHPPVVDGGGPIEDIKLVLEITKDGQYFLDGDPVAEADLANALKTEATDPPEQRGVIVQGDKETLCKHIVSVFAKAKEAEYKTVTLSVVTKTSRRFQMNEPAKPATSEQPATIAPNAVEPPVVPAGPDGKSAVTGTPLAPPELPKEQDQP